MNPFRVPLMVLLAFLAVNSVSAGTLTIGNAGDLSITPGSELLLSGGDSLTTFEGGLVLIGGDIDLSVGTIPTVPDDAYDIFVGGTLYLDYSVFSTGQDLNLSGSITLSGETIAIFSPEQEPVVPDLSTTTVLQNPSMRIDAVGDILLFSDSPVLNAIFEATDSIYVGNYSSLRPVPLPASLVLFLSGIAALASRKPS
jgi:hypothetical protein